MQNEDYQQKWGNFIRFLVKTLLSLAMHIQMIFSSIGGGLNKIAFF